MRSGRLLFDAIPDTVFITDTYGYILDFNRRAPFDQLKKGKKITKYLPDCFENAEGEFRLGDRVYRRYTTKLDNGKNDTGYTVRLSDMTEEAKLSEQLEKRKSELSELESRLSESNAELTDFVMRVKELSDYSEQLRVARIIHDDYGHALTELFVICQMCLKLKDTDPERCLSLLREGMDICARAKKEKEKTTFGSVEELLHDFASKSPFPVELYFEGKEPDFAKDKYDLIGRACREAYHNTLGHSLANRFFVTARMSENEISLLLSDDGVFRGTFEKGFGLSAMENAVLASDGNIDFIAEEGRGFTIRITWRKQSWKRKSGS